MCIKKKELITKGNHQNRLSLKNLCNVELPSELYNKTNIKYLLNLIDHFSKYDFGLSSESKKAEIILLIIKECFEKIGFPDELRPIMIKK